MPIRTTEQQAGSEVHDIGTGTGTQRGKDFIESPTLLGKTNLPTGTWSAPTATTRTA